MIEDQYEFGKMVDAHVRLALTEHQVEIEAASVLAAKAGVGVLIGVKFDIDGIKITAEPDVRVPSGTIRMPDFTKFKRPKNG